VVWIGALGAGIAYLLYYRLITDVGPTTASFATYLIPIFGTLLGWLVRDETLGLNALAGAVLVISGITIAERARSRAAANARLASRPTP
jgi:drug/metabolite transporter (DMT)-like permease